MNDPKTHGSTDDDDANDSELLDLLQAQQDASLVGQMDRDVLAAADSQTTPADAAAVAATTTFLVGGSLFSDRRRLCGGLARPFGLLRRNRYSTQRTNLHLLDTRGRVASMGALHVGSIYCPFTRQFVSLSSPHWHHLRAIGFGLDASIQGGRRVCLVSASRLYRLACKLQGRHPVFARSSQTTSAPVPSPARGEDGRGTAIENQRNATTTSDNSSRQLAPPACAAGRSATAQAYYADRCWSPLLARSLGALLETVAVDTYGVFRHGITRTLRTTSSPLLSRTIDLGFVPVEDGSGLPSTNRMEALAWRDIRLSCLADGVRGKHGSVGNALPTPESPQLDRERLGRFGDAFIRSTALWRRAALQLFAKTAEWQDIWGVGSPAGCVAPELSVAPLAGGDGLPSVEEETDSYGLVSALLSRASLPVPMLGLPPQTRVAVLVAPVQGDTGEAWACEMNRAVWATVKEVERTLAPDTLLYLCPVEHSIDYNTVLDLVAVPLARGTEPLSRAHLHHGVPLLSLGLEGECVQSAEVRPRKRVVVFSNAHLLSRHAVGRLLDQWTRNGAALRAIERRNLRSRPDLTSGPRAPEGQDASMRWRLLLRAEPFTSRTRVRYHLPFGQVQALFLSQHFCSQGWSGDGTCPDAHQHAAAERQPLASLFHLQEPLAAALLRCGMALGHIERSTGSGVALTATRAAMLRAICLSAVRQLPESMMVTHAHSTITPSARHVFQETTVPLCSSRGQRLFHAACDSLLSSSQEAPAGRCDAVPRDLPLLSNPDTVSRLLVTYPFLSQIHCQHRLVHAYCLQVKQATTQEEEEDRAGATTDKGAATTSAVADVVALTDAQQLRDNHTAANAWLLRLARGTVWTLMMRHRMASKGKDGDRGATGRAAPRLRPLLEQRYESFTEPPLLLGLWTPTQLFCAPAVADVLPLRHYLLERLRDAWRRRRGCVGTGKGKPLPPTPNDDVGDVADVDIYHVDFVVFPLDRRCRLFGVRALLRQCAEEAGQVRRASRVEDAILTAHECLQGLLKAYAAAPLFFPVWAYHVRSHGTADNDDASRPPPRGTKGNCGRPAGEDPKPNVSRDAVASSALPNSRGWSWACEASRKSARLSHYAFSSVDEWCSPCPPGLVERRLFALEAAQRPPMHLIVGCHVVLTSPITVAGCEEEEDEPVRIVPRGTVCRVDRFAQQEDFPRLGDCAARRPSREHRLSSSQLWCDIRLYQSEDFRRMTSRYLAQQRDATTIALPVLTPVQHALEADELPAAFVIAPQSSLIGGYRSLHYYALPSLHLPVLLLVEKVDRHVTTPSRDFFKNARHPSAPFPVNRPIRLSYPAKHLLHPYHADQDALAFVALTARQRCTVLEHLTAAEQGAEGSDAMANPFTLVEDVILSSGAEAPTTTTTTAASEATIAAPATGKASAGVPMVDLTPFAEESSLKTAVFSCGALTSVSLLADSGDF